MIQYRRDLWRLVKDVPGNLAEIGIAEGLFSRDMLEWPLVPAPKLFMVDRWLCTPEDKGDSAHPQEWHDRNFADAKARVTRFGVRVIILRGDSVEMASYVPDRSLRLVYLDAGHDYKSVTNDIQAWAPKLVPGGCMAFHDYENPAYGIKQAVAEYCAIGGLASCLLPEDKWEDAGAYFVC